MEGEGSLAIFQDEISCPSNSDQEGEESERENSNSSEEIGEFT
jgi:hypothetical protein